MLEGISKKDFLLLLSCCLITLATSMSLDIYVPSMPIIAKAFYASPNIVQMTISSYLLGKGISCFICGPISDRFGRKSVMYTSLLLYIISCNLIISTNSILCFVIYRFFQGVAAGSGIVLCRIIICEYFDSNKVSKIMAIFGLVTICSPLFAPFIGGYIDEHLGWQYSFILLVILSLFALFLYYFFCPETKDQSSIDKINIRNIFLNAKEIMSNKLFIICLLSSGFLSSICKVFPTLGPFLYQVKYNFSASDFGVFCLIGCFGSIPGDILFTFICDYFTSKVIFLWSAAILFFLSLFMLTSNMLSILGPYMIVIIIFLMGILINCIFPILSTTAVFLFDKTKLGIANSLLWGLSSVITAIILLFISLFPDQNTSEIAISFFVISLLLFISSMFFAKYSKLLAT